MLRPTLLFFFLGSISATTDFFCASDSSSAMPIDWKCDGMIDCEDGSDEHGCVNSTCVSDGRLIYENWKCDGVPDCKDGSDEWNCQSVASFEMWTCSDGWDQIPSDWKCDGFPDCVDRSDENNCGDGVTQPANPFGEDAFTCADGKQQIPWEWECDGVVECDDGSDEDCGENDFFTCTSGETIPIDWECDYAPDCNDGSDEHSDCPPEPMTKFECLTGNQKIEFNWVCDGTLDCRDGSDERDGNGCASSNAFRCNNGGFVPLRFKCDRVTDCWDGTDEEGCPRFPLPKEIENEFRIGVTQFIRFLNRLQRTRDNYRSIKDNHRLLKSTIVRSVNAFMRAENLTDSHNQKIGTMLQDNVAQTADLDEEIREVSKEMAGMPALVRGAEKNVESRKEQVDLHKDHINDLNRQIRDAKAHCTKSCTWWAMMLSVGISCSACKSWHSLKDKLRPLYESRHNAGRHMTEAVMELDECKEKLSELEYKETILKSRLNEKTDNKKELNATMSALSKASAQMNKIWKFVKITHSRSKVLDSTLHVQMVSLIDLKNVLTAIVENSNHRLYSRLTAYDVGVLEDKLEIFNQIVNDYDDDDDDCTITFDCD